MMIRKHYLKNKSVMGRLFKLCFYFILLCLTTHVFGSSLDESLRETFDEGIDQWEVPPPHWQLGKNLFEPSYDRKGGMDGSGALRFNGQASKIGRVFKNIKISPEPQILSVWIKTQGFASGWVAGARIFYLDSHNKFLPGSDSVGTSSGETDIAWTRYSLELNPPEGAARVRVLLETGPVNNKADESNNGTVWLDNLCVTPASNASQPYIRGIYPEGTYGLLTAEEPLTFDVQYARPTTKPLPVHVELSDWQKKVVWEAEQELPVSPGGRGQIIVPAGMANAGFYTLTVTENVSQSPSATVHRSTSVILPAGTAPASDPFFTITGFRHKPFLAETMHNLGVGTVLFRTPWRELQEQAGPCNWNQADADLQTYRQAGLQVIGLFQMHPPHERKWLTPAWEISRLEQHGAAGYECYDDKHFQNAAFFAKEAVAHFGDKLDGWYLMDEIDIPMRQDWNAPMQYYVRRVNDFIRVAREVNPEVEIHGVGVAPPDTKNGYLAAKAVWSKLDPGMTGFWPHVYPTPHTLGRNRVIQTPESFLPADLYEALDVVKSYGVDELGVSEWGYEILAGVDSVYSSDAIHMAELTARSLVLVRSIPQLKHFAYFTLIQNKGDKEGRGGFGLWDVQGGGSLQRFNELNSSDRLTPRPVLAAYATVARLLAFPQNNHQLALPKNLYGFLFQTKERAVLPLWTTQHKVALHCTLPVSVSVVDMMGQTVEILDPGEQTLTLTEAPIYLLAEPGNGEALALAIENSRNDLPPVSLHSRLLSGSQIAVSLTSQKSTTISVEVTMDLSGMDVLRQIITLEPEAEETLQFLLSDKVAGQLIGKGLECRVTAAVEGQPLVQQNRSFSAMTIPRRNSPPVIDGKLDDQRAYGAVRVEGQEDLCPPDAKPGGIWLGNDDASFTAWATWDETALYLAFDIHDDIFIQENLSHRFFVQDHMAVAIDTANDALPDAVLDENDFEITMSLNPDTGNFQVFCHRAPVNTPMERGIVEFPAAIQQRDDGMSIEFALPWDRFFATHPVPGQVLPMTFTYGDADVAGKFMNYWMQLTPGIHGGKNPSAYQPFVLGE